MISSFQNPLVKQIRRLKLKKYRQKEALFFAEGLRVVLSAIEHGAPVETLVYAPSLLDSEYAINILAEQQEAGARCIEVTAEIFAALSDRERPVGLGALIRTFTSDITQISIGSGDIYVAAVDVSEPGNLGTILRTIDAAGGNGLFLIGQSVDPFHPKAVKASMGSLFTVPVYEISQVSEVLVWARDQKVHTIATSARAERSFWEVSYAFPALLLLGSEGEGLPAEVLTEAEAAVSIPMLGTATSLNLAVAAGLLLYELRRSLGF